MQDADIIVPWLAISNTGLWCLVILLITYAFSPWLPQRNNPYLVNFVLATLIGIIPPSLLLYSGYQYSSVPSRLCMAQFSLVIGVSPLFATAQLALVFDNWSELLSLRVHKRNLSRIQSVKCISLIAPYFAFGVWSFFGYQAVISSNLNKVGHVPSPHYVYCRAGGKLADSITGASGLFILIITSIQVFFEVWVAWMIYAYPSKVHDDPTTWQTNIQFSLRVIILSMLQLFTVFLLVLNSRKNLQNPNVKRASELLESMNPLAAFLIVGLQKNVLQTWQYALVRLWDIITRKEPENPDELQPQGYPVLQWEFVSSRKFELASGSNHPEFEAEERGFGLGGSRMAYPKFLSRLKLWRR